MLVELHCHSNFSDGKASIEEILKYAKSIGLGAIAITDHDTGKGSDAALKLAKNYGIIVIPGIEIKCRDRENDITGEVIALGTNTAFTGDIPSVADKIHAAGGMAVAAHPFGGMWNPVFRNKEMIKEVDAVEVMNAAALPWRNNRARQAAERYKKPMVSGSDAHTLEELGKAACRISADSLDGILKAIKKGEVVLPKNTSAFSVIKAKAKRRFLKFL